MGYLFGNSLLGSGWKEGKSILQILGQQYLACSNHTFTRS